MKKLFFFASVIFTSFQIQIALSQPFTKTDSVIGKKFNYDQAITATIYSPPINIYRWNVNENSDHFLLQLRETDRKGTSFKNKGTCIMMDLNDKHVKWEKEMDYGSDEIKKLGRHLFLTKKNKTYALDPETGNELWNMKNDVYFADTISGIALCYPFSPTSNKLIAVNLNTGKELWNKKLDRTLGWNNVYLYNDSLVLISVNGLNGINLATGNSWKYEAKTTRQDIGKLVAKNAAGILLGAFTGIALYQTAPDVATDMVSNILIDPSGDIVLASRDKISRMGSAGTIVWSTPLPEKITSKSSLFLIDSVIYMINRGYAQYNGNFSMIGDPYFAAFDRACGQQLYLNAIPEKKEFIRNYQVIDDKLFLVFKNKIASYSLDDGSLLNETPFPLNKDEKLVAFVESGAYVKQNDSTYLEVLETNPDLNFILTDHDRMFAINDNLELLNTYDKEQTYHQTLDFRNYRFITNDDETYVVLDPTNKLAAELKLTPHLFVADGTLYAMDHNSFLEIDLSHLFE